MLTIYADMERMSRAEGVISVSVALFVQDLGRTPGYDTSNPPVPVPQFTTIGVFTSNSYYLVPYGKFRKFPQAEQRAEGDWLF